MAHFQLALSFWLGDSLTWHQRRFLEAFDTNIYVYPFPSHFICFWLVICPFIYMLCSMRKDFSSMHIGNPSPIHYKKLWGVTGSLTV